MEKRIPAGLMWQKSTRSVGDGACVEVAQLGSSFFIRDSKHRDGSTLAAGVDAWRQFIASIKNCDYRMIGE